MVELGNVYRILIRKPEGKRHLGRPRCRFEDNNKIYLMELGFLNVFWIRLAQDTAQWRALVNAVVKIRFL